MRCNVQYEHCTVVCSQCTQAGQCTLVHSVDWLLCKERTIVLENHQSMASVFTAVLCVDCQYAAMVTVTN